MDFTRSSSSISRMGGDLDLVQEIVLRLAATKSLIRCSILNKAWYTALKEPGFLSRYMKKNSPSFLGFLVDYHWMPEVGNRLQELEYSSKDETSLAISSNLDSTYLLRELVVCCWNGVVLIQVFPHGSRDPGYYVNYPSRSPNLFTFLASPVTRMPSISKSDTDHSYG